ncbi:MAG: hypothetical protein ACI4QN_02270 [Candidatus Coproplasma sp.]
MFDKNYRVSGNDMTRNDIGLYYSSHILKIGSEMSAGAIEERNSIYVRRDKIGTFTTGWGKYNPTVKPETRFKSANSTYRIGSSGAGALKEATMLSNNNNDNWVFAINNSRSSSGEPELFTLISDWTASNYNIGSYNTRFGSDGNAYRNGALLVPVDANIVIDLNGFTLDRNHALNLDSKYAIYNAVIIVEGTLQIIDSSVTNQGTIKGGSYGVFLNGTNANVTLGGLLITEDTVLTGNEVNVYGSDKYGGNISGNSLYGVNVNARTFTATGGKVTGNTNCDVFVSNTNSTINVGENAYIYTENRKVGSGLRLESPLAMINIISTLSEDAKIGYMRQGVGRLTNGWGLYNGNDTDPFETVFISEEPDKYKSYSEMFDEYKEITVSSYDNGINWQFAVDKSLATGEAQQFILYECWTAAEHETYTTAFGTGTAYRNGALYVPEGANVILNLNGHTLNRNLTSAIQNGMIIFVEGTLTIIDDQSVSDYNAECCELVDGKRPDGQITGGKNATGSSSAAIYIGKTGSVTLTAGQIVGNKATSESSSSGAIFAAGTFEMTGGSISGNSGYGAGAVYVSNSGTFNFSGGVITENKAESGGGAIYTSGKVNLSGGSIDGNQGLIGGVYVASGGQLTMEDNAYITNNMGSSAGAVFVNNGSNTFFKMLGGCINDNSAVSAGAIYAAGVVEISGGEIKGNSASGTTINDGGGAIYISGTGNVTVTGGEITGNTGENGIRVHASGTIGVGGSARIYNNIAKNKTNVGGAEVEANDYCDIYLTVSTRNVYVVSEFNSDAKVGVYRLGAGIFTSGYGLYNSGKPSDYFVSNRSIYSVSLSVADDATDCEASVGIAVDPEPHALTTPYEYSGGWENIIVDIDTDKVNIGTLDEGVRVYVNSTTGATSIQAVNAGTYAVSFTLKENYCWLDGTVTEKIVLGKVAPKTVVLEWEPELHEGESCVYDGVTTHGPVVKVADSSLCTNVLIGELDTCDVAISGRQITASPDGGHTATAVGLSNTNYKLGVVGIEYNYIVEKAERPQFQIVSYEAYYNTPTEMEVEGNIENGAVTFSLDEASQAYATVDPVTGELTISKFSKTVDTYVTLIAVAAETVNYKESTAIKQILCVPGELKTTITTEEMIYGETITLALENYNSSEMGNITWSISNGDDGGRASMSGDKITAINVGTINVIAQVAASNFYKASTIKGTITIKRRPITVDWGDSLSVEYTGSPQTLAAPSYEGVLTNDEAMFRLNVYKAGYAGWETAKVAPTWTDAGKYDVGLVPSNNNYELANSDDCFRIFEIRKATLNLRFTSDTAYYDKPFYPEVEGNVSGGLLTISLMGYSEEFKSEGTYKYDATNKLYTAWALGTFTFKAQVAATANYESASLIGTYTIVESEMPLMVEPVAFTYGDSKVQLTAYYYEPSGLKVDVTDKVTFELLEGDDIADLAPENGQYLVNANGVGKIKIKAYTSEQIGNYLPTEIEVEIEILPKILGSDDDYGDSGGGSGGESGGSGGESGGSGGESGGSGGESGGSGGESGGSGGESGGSGGESGGSGGSGSGSGTSNPVIQWNYADKYIYNGEIQMPTATLLGGTIGDDVCAIASIETYAEDGVTKVDAINVGTYIVKATLDNPNYVLSSSSYGKFTIEPLAVVLTWSNTQFVYNATEQAPTATVSNLIGGDECTVTVLGTKNAGDNLNAVAMQLDNPNYTLVGGENLTTIFFIDPYEITVEWGETELVYTGFAQKPTAMAVGLFAGDSCTVMVSGDQINVNDPEEPYLATAIGLTNSNYTLGDKAPATQFNIIAAEITLSFKQTTVVYGSPFTLEVTGNLSGAKVTFTLGDGAEKATLGTGNWFTPVDIGPVTVTASVPATGNYNAAEVTQVITITPLPVKILWSDLEFTYDGEEHNATAAVDNAVNGDLINLTLSSAQINAGYYMVQVIGLDNNKYTLDGGENVSVGFTIKKRLVTVEWSNLEFTYSGVEQMPTATLGNLIGEDVCTAIVRGAVEAANRHLAEILSLSNPNYTVEGSDDATVRFNIKPKLVMLEWSNTTLTYDGTEQKPTAKAINLYGNDSCSVTVSGAQINVGTYTATATGLSNSNYTLIFDEAEVAAEDRPEIDKEFEIVKADIMIAVTTTEVVFGSQITLSLVSNPENGEVTYVAEDGTGSAEITNQNLKGTKAGTVNVTVTVADTDNYNGATDTFIVTVRKLAVVIDWAQESEFIYNGTVQTPTPTIANLVEGTTCNITEVNGESDAGNSRIAKVLAIDNDNYTLDGGTNVIKTYVIQPRLVTAIVWDENREYPYNGERQGPKATAEGILDDDECEVIVSGYKINSGEYTAEITGLSNSNYSLDGISNLTADFTILVSKPTITITTNEVVLGTREQIKISGNVGGGDVTYELIDGSDYGELSGDTLYGKRLGTVTIRVSVGATANTAAATVEGDIKIIKGYAPLSLVKTVVTYGSNLTLVADDDSGNLRDDEGNYLFGDVTYTIEPRFDGRVATIVEGNILKPLSAGELILKMSVEENDYFEATEVLIPITIKARVVTLLWTIGEYTYNTLEQSPTVSVTNLVGDDECLVTVSTGKYVGDYTSRAIALSNSNYTLEKATNTEAAFSIKPCLITLDWGDMELEYNGEEQIPDVTLVGLYENDDCDVNLEVLEGEHYKVGNYTLKTNGLTNSNYYLDSDIQLSFSIVRADINPKLSPTTVTYSTSEELSVLGNFDDAPYTMEVLKHESVGAGTLELVKGVYVFTATRTGVVKIQLEIEETDNCNAYSGVIEIEVIKAEREVDLITVEGVYGEDLTLEISGNEDDPGTVKYIVADSEMASVEGNVLTPKHAGTVTVTIIVSETSNYKDEIRTVAQITISPRIVDISWKNTEFIYNGSEQTPEAEVSNLLDGDECGVTVVGGRVNAGTYNDARVIALDNPDYTLVGSLTSGTIFTIGKKDIDIDLLTTRVNIGVPTKLEIKGNDGNATLSYSIENTSGQATIDADGVMNPVLMGSVTVTVSVAESENYLAGSVTKLVIIDRSTLTLTMETTTVKYGDNLLLEVEGNVENSPILYSVIDATGSASIIGGDTLKPLRAGKVLVRVNIAETTNFAATEAEFEITITPLDVELVWGNFEFTYDGINRFAPTAKVSSGLINGETCNVLVLGSQLDAGEYDTAYAASLDNPNYTLANANVRAPKFVIKKADPIIIFKTTAVTINVPTKIEIEGNMEFGSIDFTMGSVGPEVTPIGAATISGGVLTGTKLGYVHVIATVMPTQNYNGGSVECDILVEKPEAPVDLEVSELTYGDTIELNVIIDSEEIGGYTLSVERIDGNTGNASLSDYIFLTGLSAGEVYVVISTDETDSYKATNKKILVTVKPIVVIVDWSDTEFDYDGTEKTPTATITNLIGDDVCTPVVSGQINAGVGLVATLTDTGNPNYTVEGSDTAATTFTIYPRVVTLEWDLSEVLTYNGLEQAPKATVTNLVDGESVEVTVSGGINAGTNTATATALDNANYTLEGADITTEYVIKQYEVYIAWGELTLVYNGSVQVPEATAIGTLNGDIVKATVIGDGKDVKNTAYIAQISTLNNKNYKAKGPDENAPTDASAGPVAGNLMTDYCITAAKITFLSAQYEVTYNGSPQNPVIEIDYLNATDKLTWAFEGGNKTDVGEYEVKLKITGGDGESTNNYYLAEEDATKTFKILPKTVKIKVTTIDKSAEYTGSAVSISDWYTLNCDEFVGAEKGLTVLEVFAVNTLQLTPQYEVDGNLTQSVGLRGTYKIVPVLPGEGSLAGSANYVAELVVDEDNYGMLTISGGDALKLAEGSTFEFLYLEEKGGTFNEMYRRTYTAMGFVHGKDDTDFEKVVLGNIATRTSVGDLLNNLDVDQLDYIRVYSNKDVLIYDCGKPAEGISEADLYNQYLYSVGTGWRILYGKEEDMADVVYISVLGDLNGDGTITTADITAIGKYIKGVDEFNEIERKFAGLITNLGYINAIDISSLSMIIKQQDSSSDYF